MLESADEMAARLLRVIAAAEFAVLPGVYEFAPMPEGPRQARADALACVCDGDVWTQLIPVAETRPRTGGFTIFSFHFAATYDATGFVGWLHAHLARTIGVGHIVVCGRDRRRRDGFDHVRGGIFDYWGAPADRADAAIAEVRRLIERGRTA